MLHLFVATPEKIIFDGTVASVLIPGTYGYFQVLKDHTPLIASLTAGKLEIADENGKKTIWAISGGLAEVFHNETTILGDAVELASEIDVKHAEFSLKHAQKILESSNDEEAIMLAKEEVKRARNRLKIAQTGKREKS